jgi:hypothetical protein
MMRRLDPQGVHKTGLQKLSCVRLCVGQCARLALQVVVSVNLPKRSSDEELKDTVIQEEVDVRTRALEQQEMTLICRPQGPMLFMHTDDRKHTEAAQACSCYVLRVAYFEAL